MPMHPALTVFDDRIFQAIQQDFEIKLLDSSCAFSEGPVWNPSGFYLFSDIPNNRICKISETGNKETYLEPSGCDATNTRDLAEQIGSNGLAYDATGLLWICQHGNGAVATFDGTFSKPHITSFNGQPFNSPNDIVVHPDGSVFFSDPPYGLKDKTLNPAQGQDRARVYCWRNGSLQIVTENYQYPNGVCLSPDNKTFYTGSNKPFEARVEAWDVATLQWQKTVAHENADGIKCDRFGNFYLCTNNGLLILDEKGTRLGLIAFETIPANCCWGGQSGTDLLVTARQHIFLIKNLQQA